VAIACVDEVWLREPRLLVPRMQPLGPVKVDVTNPLARSCEGFIVGGSTLNLVPGGAQLIRAMPSTIVPTIDGGVKAFLHTSADAYTETSLRYGAGNVTAASGFSILHVTKYVVPSGYKAQPTAGVFSVGAGGSNADGHYISGQIPGESNKIRATSFYDNTAWADSNYVDAIHGDVNYSLGTFRANGTGRTIYSNGIASATETTTNNPTFTDQAIFIGNYFAGNSFYFSFNGYTYCAAWWARELSAAEAQQIMRDPYQILTVA
jgi:hypothetical protein